MCWDCYNDGIDPYKEFRQGGVSIEDFDEEIKYRHPKNKKKSRAVKKTRAGCPETDYSAHVYVWTTEREVENLFFKFYGYHARESEICVGCGKKRKSRHTEKYEKRKAREWKKVYGDEFSVKRGEVVPRAAYGPSYRWWHWESRDQKFREFREEYARTHGENPWSLMWY